MSFLICVQVLSSRNINFFLIIIQQKKKKKIQELQ